MDSSLDIIVAGNVTDEKTLFFNISAVCKKKEEEKNTCKCLLLQFFLLRAKGNQFTIIT